MVACVEGVRIDDARHLPAELAAVGFDLPLDPLWTLRMVEYADAAIACRDPQYAGPLFDRLEEWADQLSTSGASTAQG